MKDIAGTIAFVTGGASGIGLGIARGLAREGARVVIADIDGEGAERAATGLGGGALGLKLDVTDEAGWRDAVARVEREVGRIDILVNNAGVVGAFKPLVEQDLGRIRRLFEINVFAPIIGIQAVVPGMVARGRGHVVNTASMSAWDSVATLSEYSASKRALVGFSEALRDELADKGVGVTALCPGLVATNLSQTSSTQFGEAERLADSASSMRSTKGQALDPDAVGPMVVDAIRDNRLFAFTQAANRPRIENRLTEVWRALDWFEGR